MYHVKEIFYSLQGEGTHSGRPAVFCRLSGCNLWNGRQEDRQTALCSFCDTDFVGTDGQNGGRFADALALAKTVRSLWTGENLNLYVVLTGGEPLLQLDRPLIDALHNAGFTVALETNGTLEVPAGVDWVCVSPKACAPFIQRTGDELKLVFPQSELMPHHLGETHFTHYYLQPMDGPTLHENTVQAIAYCKAFPKWRLSLQTHKFLGID